MKHNETHTVFSINGSSQGHIIRGAGQDTVKDILKHYPSLYPGKVNIVVLKGFMINGEFSPFNPGLYATRWRN